MIKPFETLRENIQKAFLGEVGPALPLTKAYRRFIFDEELNHDQRATLAGRLKRRALVDAGIGTPLGINVFAHLFAPSWNPEKTLQAVQLIPQILTTPEGALGASFLTATAFLVAGYRRASQEEIVH